MRTTTRACVAGLVLVAAVASPAVAPTSAYAQQADAGAATAQGEDRTPEGPSPLTATGYWNLQGNSGTTPPSNFMGTTDAQDVVFKVNGLIAMTYQQIGSSSSNPPNILGGKSNSITAGVTGAVIAGGGYAGGGNNVSDHFGVIGGGAYNIAGDQDADLTDMQYATVGGGWSNWAKGYMSVVAGGRENWATGSYSAVGGGYYNRLSGSYAIVGGGSNNVTTADYASVCGGYSNWAEGTKSFVGGGGANDAQGTYATVGGGYNNGASDYGFVGGGTSNEAEGSSVVAGGQDNHAVGTYSAIAGGSANYATADYATVAGGFDNHAEGTYSTVLGGSSSYARAYRSLAAGNNASITSTHSYAFVWSGTDNANGTTSVNPKTVTMRAANGFTFYTSDSANTGLYVPAGGTAWQVLSDRNMKQNVVPVKPREVLEKLVLRSRSE